MTPGPTQLVVLGFDRVTALDLSEVDGPPGEEGARWSRPACSTRRWSRRRWRTVATGGAG